MARIKTLDDFDVAGRTVLVRTDFNCPVEPESGRIKDDTRIRAAAPTISELARKGARVVILSHQGDPLDYQNFFSLREHATRLQHAMGGPVEFIDDVCGPAARERIRTLRDGEVLLLENVRYHTEETIIFEKQVGLSPERQAKTPLVARLAPLAHLYVCDAFACVHRSQPSLVGFPQLLPSAAGRLFQREMETLLHVRERPEHPCVFVLGGAKILDAFAMMQTVLENGAADEVLTGGLVANVFLAADGVSLGEPSMRVLRDLKLEGFIPTARDLLRRFGDRIRRPVDVGIEGPRGRKDIAVADLPSEGRIMDIGPATLADYAARIERARTIFFNGPAGVYEDEKFASGTRGVLEAIGRSSGFSLIGGGDSIAAANRFRVADRISYVCTAGGGLILFLSGKPLPVIQALEMAAARNG